MRRVLLLSGLVTLLVKPIGAQIAVHDPANTARNSISAAIKEYLVETQRSQRERMDRMSQRLSRLSDLHKYSLPEPPEWRIHDFFDDWISPLARDYHAALTYGDRT